MRFVSTRNQAPPASLPEALFQGLAQDGGLYQPDPIPSFSARELARLRTLAWPSLAQRLALPFLGSTLARDILDEVVSTALDFPIPLVPLGDRLFVLELFRGPTLAFKDVGARFMARLMERLRRGGGEAGARTESIHLSPAGAPPSHPGPPSLVTVLTATSGDTGGAVAQAFLGLEGIRVVVLFPDGQVTPRQERQFSTLGGNVLAVAVQGDFDACQRLAKEAFRDAELRTRLALTSANSINVGRFLPQSFYYVHAWAQLAQAGLVAIGPREGTASDDGALPTHPSGGTSRSHPEILFSVPSGNFGNLAAGLLAKAMGLPGVRFLAATNANDEVPRYLKTGSFQPRPSLRTLSTAMDVGDPSNLDRILHLYGAELERLRQDVTGRSVSDPETLACMRRVWDRKGYVLDPHSAVGMAALEQELAARPGAVGVLLATAHPAKFAEIVEPALGETLPVPPELARCLDGERNVVPMQPAAGALREILLGG
jgi:threonine synthase